MFDSPGTRTSSGSESSDSRMNNDISSFELHDIDSIISRECSGVGYYEKECPTAMKTKKSNFIVTLSDEFDIEETMKDDEQVLLTATIEDDFDT